MRTALYWAPRILAIAFGLFVSLFALDSFSGQDSIWLKLGHFAVHLIPVAIYAAILVLAWRWEWIGAVLFAALGALYIASVGRHRLDWNLIIAGPLFLLAVLFLAGWLRRTGVRAH
jgi:glucose-6-phosphate-specific signal transduction histidine kinase